MENAKKPQKPKKKRPVGHPSKYKKKFCRIIEEELSKGFSKEASASSLGIDWQTIYDWIAKYPEFAQAVKRGESNGLKLFEHLAVSKATGRKILQGEKDISKNCNDRMIQCVLNLRYRRLTGPQKEVKVVKNPEEEGGITVIFKEFGTPDEEN